MANGLLNCGKGERPWEKAEWLADQAKKTAMKQRNNRMFLDGTTYLTFMVAGG
jgi:hypothetical protein